MSSLFRPLLALIALVASAQVFGVNCEKKCEPGQIWSNGCEYTCLPHSGSANAWCGDEYRCMCEMPTCWHHKELRCVEKVPVNCSVDGGGIYFWDCLPNVMYPTRRSSNYMELTEDDDSDDY